MTCYTERCLTYGVDIPYWSTSYGDRRNTLCAICEALLHGLILWNPADNFGLIGAGVQSLVASIFGSGLPKLFTFLLHDRVVLGPLPLDLGGTPNFILGVILCVISVLSGGVILVASYFIAEEINVLANIAESLNNMETKLLSEEPPSDN